MKNQINLNVNANRVQLVLWIVEQRPVSVILIRSCPTVLLIELHSFESNLYGIVCPPKPTLEPKQRKNYVRNDFRK